eukprot:c28343_g2_i1 orf=733-954(-)
MKSAAIEIDTHTNANAPPIPSSSLPSGRSHVRGDAIENCTTAWITKCPPDKDRIQIDQENAIPRCLKPYKLLN